MCEFNQGKREGKQEEKLEIARNLLKNTSLSLEEISKNTGLPQEEIKKLENEI